MCVWGIYIRYYIHPYAILYISVCFLLSRVLRQDFYGIAQSKKKKEMKEIPTFLDFPKRLYVRAFVRTRSNGEIERKKEKLTGPLGSAAISLGRELFWGVVFIYFFPFFLFRFFICGTDTKMYSPIEYSALVPTHTHTHKSLSVGKLYSSERAKANYWNCGNIILVVSLSLNHLFSLYPFSPYFHP